QRRERFEVGRLVWRLGERTAICPIVLLQAGRHKSPPLLRQGGGRNISFSGWPVPGLVVFGALPSSTLPSLRKSRPSCALRWLSGDLPCSCNSSLTKPAPSLISPLTLISLSLFSVCHGHPCP